MAPKGYSDCAEKVLWMLDSLGAHKGFGLTVGASVLINK